MEISIRNEAVSDHRKVEELTREAFWNLYVPGCGEHYLVHILRDNQDFIRDLDFIAVRGEEVIGNIVYMKSFVVNEPGNRIDTITFGPLSVLPEFQKKGVGSALIKHSVKKAMEAGYKAVVIYGDPHNYCRHGFKNGKDYGVSDPEVNYPISLFTGWFPEGAPPGWAFTSMRRMAVATRPI